MPVEGVQDQVGAEVVGRGPADDETGKGVRADREVQPALVGALLGDVGHPEPIRCWWGEPPLDQVQGRDSGRVAAGQATASTAVDTHQVMLAHQPWLPFAADPAPHVRWV